MKKILLLLVFFSISAHAGPVSDFLQGETKELFKGIDLDREYYENNPNALELITRERIYTLFDWEKISRFVLARHWRSLNKQKKQLFIDEFSALLLTTYSQLLIKITFDDLTFQEERKGLRKGTYIVPSIVQSDTKKYRYEYFVIEEKKVLRIVDLRVEGLSLLINYRKAYAEQLENKDIDQFLNDIISKNNNSAIKN